MNIRLYRAISTDRRNTRIKSLRRCLKAQCLAGSLVQLPGHGIEFRLGVYRQVGAFGEILSQQAVGIFIRAPLPRALRIAEVHLDVGGQGESLMIGHLLAPVPGE